MPLTLNGPRNRASRYLITSLSALLPIALGVVILYWQAERSLEQSTAQTAHALSPSRETSAERSVSE